MSKNNSFEITTEINETNIKEELYILFLEIKGELKNKFIEIDKSQFDEKVSNFKTKTLINYLKEIVYILLNNKFKINQEEKNNKENNNYNNTNNNEINELQNEIMKYQADIRNLIQKQFQYKIQNDAMEIKLNSYKEMEKDYDILKEKVKYEEGRFLNNDRKDNEILILREENSNLKKEIMKKEKNSKNYESLIENEKMRIKELKMQLSQLNNKIILLESNNLIQNNNIINNNYSTIHNHNHTILTKGRTSSHWSKKKDKEKDKDKDKEERLQSINSHLTCNNTNTNHSLKKKKIINAKYSKLEVRAIGNSNIRTLSRGNSTNIINLNTKQKKLCKGITTIDNNSKISETYNKILNSLMNSKTNNNISTKKTTITSSHKKHSESMCFDNKEKNYEKRNIKRSLSKKFRQIKNNSGSKHKIYNKLMNGIPNSKVPLTSKNNNINNRKIIPNFPNRQMVKNNSFLTLKEKIKNI